MATELSDLCYVRKQYGRTFATVFPDGLIVPWKPLSLHEYLQYDQDTAVHLIPLGLLEDEIFKSCVLDEVLVQGIRNLKAGIVSSVVGHIWQFSGPVSSQSFEQDLETARQILYNGNSKAIHQLIDLISLAFPYKPEEIYAMDYQTFMLRVAQAENKLLQAGMLKEPVSLNIEEPVNEQPEEQQKIDARKLWEEQHKSAPTKQKPKKKYDKWYKKSPILEASQKKSIDFNIEQKEADLIVADNWTKADQAVLAHDMVKEAQVIYADVLKELEDRKKRKRGG